MGDGAGDTSMEVGKGLEHTVILLRHGESQWNSDNRWEAFTLICFRLLIKFLGNPLWPADAVDLSPPLIALKVSRSRTHANM